VRKQECATQVNRHPPYQSLDPTPDTPATDVLSGLVEEIQPPVVVGQDCTRLKSRPPLTPAEKRNEMIFKWLGQPISKAAPIGHKTGSDAPVSGANVSVTSIRNENKDQVT